MPLITENNFGLEADDVYNHLLDAMQGLSEEQAQRLNARLVLMLMNQVGDAAVIRDVLTHALKGISES